MNGITFTRYSFSEAGDRVAQFGFHDGLSSLFDLMESSFARDVCSALNQGADIAKVYIGAQTRSTFNRGYARGTTQANMAVSRARKRGDGYAAYVTFNGTRNDGWKGTVRRNAEVAFVNEYGAAHKKYGGSHPARPYVQQALDKCEDKVVNKIREVLIDKYI